MLPGGGAKEHQKTMMKYEDFALSEELLHAVRDMGFSEMTEVQQKAIPLLLEGKEIIAKAPTGTGKTCAFGIPIVEQTDPSQKAPQAVVLCPTRELCTQLCEELRALSKYKPGLRVVSLYGGQSIRTQLNALRQNPQILVGTPGRFMDHYKHRAFSLKQVKTVVLDEADEMLDMGFYKDVNWILSQMPKGFKLSMFSATISRPVMDIGWLYQRDPDEITVQPVEESKPQIKQYAIKQTGTRKIRELIRLIRTLGFHRTIIFCNTKYQTVSLNGQLEAAGFSVNCMNGDMQQSIRNRMMADFKSGKYEVLVVTDVAARGIDISDVEAVVNFDVPTENEYYLHRIGRTGRAKKSGVAFTFYSDFDIRHFEDIIRHTRSEVEFVTFTEEGELLPMEGGR